jgi:hypothetical protein
MEVTAEIPMLKTERADVATSFDERYVQELPLLNRNFTQFRLLTPGSQRLGRQHAASENPQGSIQIMMNGLHFGGTACQLDGTDNRDPIPGIIVINPNFDSISEAEVISPNYDAERRPALGKLRSPARHGPLARRLPRSFHRITTSTRLRSTDSAS